MANHATRSGLTGHRRRAFGPAAAALMTALAVIPAQAQQGSTLQQPEQGSGLMAKSAVTAHRMMVAAANPYAVSTGYEVLKRGGTAIDAAVAVQMMLNLVEPQSSGIGGGAFLVYWDARTRKLTTYDGREAAPLALRPDAFLTADGKEKPFFDAVAHGTAVGTPGTVQMLDLAQSRHGRLPWASLLEPAMTQARVGFLVSPRLSAAIADAKAKGMDRFPETAALYLDAAGQPLVAGSKLKNPAFADSLETVARNRSAGFYQGPLAESVVAAVRSAGGVLTHADLQGYEAKERSPVCVRYRVYDVCGMGPPSSGGMTVGMILKMLERYDLKAMGPTPEALHLFAEASKIAFADRNTYMADADFVDVPMGLLDSSYLAGRGDMIDPARALPPVKAGDPPRKRADFAVDTNLGRPGTSHVVIVDAEGNMVSMTTTIETGFGSRILAGGFLLNNEMTDFAFTPTKDGKPVANAIAPGKRPRSSMAPTIVLKDGQPVLVVGSPGGSQIIGYVARTIIAVLDWGMDPQAAIDMGHVINRNGKVTNIESGAGADALKAVFEAKGHEVKIGDLNSGLHAIQIKRDAAGTVTLIGGADPRREGVVMGE